MGQPHDLLLILCCIGTTDTNAKRNETTQPFKTSQHSILYCYGPCLPERQLPKTVDPHHGNASELISIN